jgi:hypothetical protein
MEKGKAGDRPAEIVADKLTNGDMMVYFTKKCSPEYAMQLLSSIDDAIRMLEDARGGVRSADG